MTQAPDALTEIPPKWLEAWSRIVVMECSPAVSMSRWWALRADSAYWIVSPWAARAAEFGWSIADLWGLPGTSAAGERRGAGVLWSIEGDGIVALTAAEVIVRSEAGARRRLRLPTGPAEAAVMPWDPDAAAPEDDDPRPAAAA